MGFRDNTDSYVTLWPAVAEPEGCSGLNLGVRVG
jgi:hypothetical protein